MNSVKKRKHNLQTNENVIVFPGMVDTLISDGLAYAEANNYVKAASCFDEAKKYVVLDDVLLSVYVLTLLETRRAKEAKQICEGLLEEKSPVFEQIVELYLTILLDLKEYSELNRVINRILKEYNFTEERKTNFNQLKDLSNRLANEQPLIDNNDEKALIPVDKDQLELKRFKQYSFIEQEQILQQAFYKDIHSSIAEIKAIVEYPDVSPTVQTLALLLLGSAGVTDTITISKFGLTQQVNPSSPPPQTGVDRMEEINEHIQEYLQKDPSKQMLTTELLHRHAYALFPFDWQGYKNEEVAKAYIDFIKIMFGEENVQINPLLAFIETIENSIEKP